MSLIEKIKGFFRKIFKGNNQEKLLTETTTEVEKPLSEEEKFRKRIMEKAKEISFEGMSDLQVRLFILNQLGVKKELTENPASREVLISQMDKFLRKSDIDYAIKERSTLQHVYGGEWFKGDNETISKKIEDALKILMENGWKNTEEGFVVPISSFVNKGEIRLNVGEKDSEVRTSKIYGEQTETVSKRYTPVFIEKYLLRKEKKPKTVSFVEEEQEEEYYIIEAQKSKYAPDGIEEQKEEQTLTYEQLPSEMPKNIFGHTEFQPDRVLEGQRLLVKREADYFATTRFDNFYKDAEKPSIPFILKDDKNRKICIDLSKICVKNIEENYDIGTLDSLSMIGSVIHHVTGYEYGSGIYSELVDSKKVEGEYAKKNAAQILGKENVSDFWLNFALSKSKYANAFKNREFEKNNQLEK